LTRDRPHHPRAKTTNPQGGIAAAGGEDVDAATRESRARASGSNRSRDDLTTKRGDHMIVRQPREEAMSIQTVDLTVKERRQDTWLLPLISGGAAVILVVAAGIGLWRSADGDIPRVASIEPAPPATTEAVPSRAVVAGTIAVPVATSTAGTDEVIYLVSTPAQADALRTDIDVRAALAARVNAMPVNERVVVLGTADADLAISAVNEIGVPGVRLVDATSRALRGPNPAPAASSDQEMYQRWQQAQVAAGPQPVSHPDGP
jgi:hypothetical protein